MTDLPKEMTAFRLVAGASAAQLETCPVPRPGPGDILIRVKAAGANFADQLMIRGTYQDTPERPFTLGMELAGEIVALGPGTDGFAPGDRVVAFSGQGAFAHYACVAANRCLPLPGSVPFDVGAAVPIAYGTSHIALERRARLQASDTLLVTGAAGGVGLTAVEIGARMGARVIAAARGPDKCAVARSAGADAVIDTDATDLRAAMLELGRADVVYDTVGGALFDAALRAVRPEARILAIGFASGTVPQINAAHLLVKNVDVIGLNWGGYLAFAPGVLTGSLRTLLDWVASGDLAPHISHRLPLAEAGRAQELLAARAATGKIIIEP